MGAKAKTGHQGGNGGGRVRWWQGQVVAMEVMRTRIDFGNFRKTEPVDLVMDQLLE